MRNDQALTVAIILVVGALIFTAYSSRESVDEFRNSRPTGEIITLKRRASPGPGLLAESRPTPNPSASASARASDARVTRTKAEPRYPPDSLCGYFESQWRGSLYEFDRQLEETLASTFPRDGTLDLFVALERGDFAEVLELGRRADSPEAEEIGFLAGMDLFEKLPGSGPTGRTASIDTRDLDAIENFRRRDPNNAFWPLAEAYLKQRENIPTDRATLLAEAASLPLFRNPVSSFYGKVRRTALETGDDRTFLAYMNFETRVPVLDSEFFRSLRKDSGKSPESDEMLKWIGKTIEGSQGAVASDRGEGPIDGSEGSFLDAYHGRLISTDATSDGKPIEPSRRQELYRDVSSRFSVNSDFDLLYSMIAGDPSIPATCEDGKLESYFSNLRRRLGIRR